MAEEAFHTIDANQDGLLDKAEFISFYKAHAYGSRSRMAIVDRRPRDKDLEKCRPVRWRHQLAAVHRERPLKVTDVTLSVRGAMRTQGRIPRALLQTHGEGQDILDDGLSGYGEADRFWRAGELRRDSKNAATHLEEARLRHSTALRGHVEAMEAHAEVVFRNDRRYR